MKKFSFLILACVACFNAIHADNQPNFQIPLVLPFDQSAKEIQAILTDEKLSEQLTEKSSIRSISKLTSGGYSGMYGRYVIYQLTTDDDIFMARVSYKFPNYPENNYIGPVEPEISFEKIYYYKPFIPETEINSMEE